MSRLDKAKPLIAFFASILGTVVTLVAVYFGAILSFKQQNDLKIQEEQRIVFADFRSLEFRIKAQKRRQIAMILMTEVGIAKGKYADILGKDYQPEYAPQGFLKEFTGDFKTLLLEMELTEQELYKTLGRIAILFPKMDSKKLDRLLNTKHFQPQLSKGLQDFAKHPPATQAKAKEIIKKEILGLEDEWRKQLDQHIDKNVGGPFRAVAEELKNQMRENDNSFSWLPLQ